MKVPLRTTMSHSPSPRMAWPWLWLLLLWSSFGVCLAKQEEGAKTSKKITTVSKCCSVKSVLLESSLGVRGCRNRTDLPLGLSRTRWHPVFFDLSTGNEVARPEEGFVLEPGFPKCKEGVETVFAVYHHESTYDDLMLLRNGSLAHRLVHRHDDSSSDRVLYPPGKYCVDDMIMAHDGANESVVEFAYICANNQYDVRGLIDDVVYPVGVSVSLLCLVATFLLYSFLPQLRDLTGKFILGICAFLAAAFALLLVDQFGWRDRNVNKVAAEISLHVCVVGVWLCLNCMGHHVWKIVTAESVFTRVTDGRRLACYTAYVAAALATITGVAVAVNFLVVHETEEEEEEQEEGREEGDGEGGNVKRGAVLNWETISAFYLPVTLLLLVNLYFYLTAQRRIARQIAYNRSMQHFQVNFDLYIKFLLVLGVWWLFFMLALLEWDSLVYISRTFHVIEGPLIFCVAMCRTRVAFLFKKYFCHDSWCCCCLPRGGGGRGGGGGFGAVGSGSDDDFLDGADCKELSVIDSLRRKAEEDRDGGGGGQYTSLLPPINPGNGRGSRGGDDGLSKSLFNVRNQPHQGEVPAPPDPDLPVGRIKRLLKSNSLTALANINWGWRKETSV